MKNLKVGGIMAFISLILWIVENSYFGWNSTPINDTEKFLDIVIAVLMYASMIIYIIPLFSLYETAVKKQEFNTNKKNLNKIKEQFANSYSDNWAPDATEKSISYVSYKRGFDRAIKTILDKDL